VRNTYLIPAHVGYSDAALVEPLACVVRGFEETVPKEGDTIAIIGLGSIGLMFAKLAKLYGCHVIAVGRRRSQLERAAALGVDELIAVEGDTNPVTTIRGLTQGRGVDIAIEAVGKPQTWQWAVDMVRRGGMVNFFGGCPNGSNVSLDTALLHYSEITCKATFHHTPAYIRKALDLVCAEHITASFFVNREEPLTNLLEVMRHLMSHNGHLKTAIFP
jgi:L-iditol 2-dehydrogenase